MLPATLRFTQEDWLLREQIRAWILTNDPGPTEEGYAGKMRGLTAWQRALYGAGFIGLSWPRDYGGQGLGLASEAVLAEELASSSMPQLINRLALYTWGPTLLDSGTEEQKRRFLPGMLDASEIWCQGFSEPDAGSDLAAVRTTARRDGDRLIVTGQKVWTSRAELAKWNAMLVRTDASKQRHSGLSVLVVDMNSPGITVRPLPQMLNEPHFSEVFFEDVSVPVDNVLGQIDEGWQVAMAAMGYERGLFVLERQIGLRRRLDDLLRLLRKTDSSEAAAERIGRIYAKLEILKAQVYRTLGEQEARTTTPGATSVDKLFLAEVHQELFAVAFDLLGHAPVGPGEGWLHDLLESRSVSIYSGTSEIQKNVIGRQLLGLR
jgi:alkylation response protein AidB-like acyl-CoA dehydrogenase